MAWPWAGPDDHRDGGGFGFRSGTLASISSSSASTVTGLGNVAAAAGGLTLNDRTLSGTVPAINFNGGGAGGGGGGGSAGSGGSGRSGGGGQSFRASFSTSSFGVDDADIGTGELGPLSSGKLSSGRTFTTADASSGVAVVDASYATQNELKTGSAIAIGNSTGTSTSFKVIGIVSEPAQENVETALVPLHVLAGTRRQRAAVALETEPDLFE